MTSAERVAAVLALQQPDRVPVSPFIIYHFATVTGIAMKDFIWDVDVCHKASLRAFDYYDGLFDLMNLTPFRFSSALYTTIGVSSIRRYPRLWNPLRPDRRYTTLSCREDSPQCERTGE